MDKDSTIREYAFGASGQWLCAWTTGGQNDQCYFWDTEGQKPPEIGYYEKVSQCSHKAKEKILSVLNRSLLLHKNLRSALMDQLLHVYYAKPLMGLHSLLKAHVVEIQSHAMCRQFMEESTY